MMRGPRHALVAASCAIALAGCGGANVRPDARGSAVVDPRRLFPLEAGTVFSYTVRDGTDLPTLATLRVLSVDGDRAVIQRNRQPEESLVVTADGIRLAEREVWLVRAPVVLDATFPGQGGRTARIGSVDEVVRTGLGEHRGCVRVDERDDANGVLAQTTYCPDVGPVRIVSSMTSELTGMRLEVRAELIGRVRLEAEDPPR